VVFVFPGARTKERKMTSFQFFDVRQSGEITELRLKDPSFFDLIQNELLRNAIVEFIQQRRPSKLLLDFSDVRYCSSPVIGVILDAQRHLVSEGYQMKLCGMNDAVRDNFKILKLDGTVFDIHTTKDDAANAF